MALQVWLPLNGDVKNQGLMDTFPQALGNGVWDNGKIGKCYNGGGNGYINIDTSIGINGAFSVAIWLKVNSFNAAWGRVFRFNKNDNEFLGMCYSSTNSIGFHIYDNVNGTKTKLYDYYRYTPVVGEWAHIAIVFDGVNTIKWYKNGNLLYTDTDVVTFVGETYLSCTICSDRNGSNKADCSINDFRLYDHTLSPREVKEISKGLVLHYPLAMPGQGNLLLNTATPVSWITTYTREDEWDVKDIYNMESPVNQLFEANDTATFSFDWKFTPGSSGSITGHFHIETGNVTPWILGSVSKSTGTRNNASNYIDLSATNTSGHVTCTFIVSSSAASAADTFRYFRIRWDKTPKDGTLKLSNCKLERGEIATPWIPNPADTAYSTLGFNDGIEYDVSGYGHNGTKINPANISYLSETPRYNSCTHISAVNSKIKITGLTTTGFANSYTFVWWGKSNSYSLKMHWGFENGIRLNGIFNGNLWNTGDSDANPLYIPGTTTQVSVPSENIWHHFAMVGDGSTCKVYLDGVLWGQAKTYKSISGTTIYINGWNASTDYCLNDLSISDFRIYATALTSDEIADLYHTPISLSNNGTLLTQGEFVES